jgi:hypothetical protein
MVNASLLRGRLPDSQRHAIVTLLLMKKILNTADMSDYRPVSNLSFMSKLIERVVANQLNEYLSANQLLPRSHSANGNRNGHSTETALLHVSSDFRALETAESRSLVPLLSPMHQCRTDRKYALFSCFIYFFKPNFLFLFVVLDCRERKTLYGLLLLHFVIMNFYYRQPTVLSLSFFSPPYIVHYVLLIVVIGVLGK